MKECEPDSFKWHFGEKRPDEVERNPIPAEFFVHESRDLADNIVREAIQNALDARVKASGGGHEPARVRFFLSGNEAALSWRQAERWFDGLAPHLCSRTSGLRLSPIRGTVWEDCPFLTCEDFGTYGLTGQPEQSESRSDDAPANFYNFFRAEALSTKAEGQGGTWGVGKTVFPMASGANAFLGLTVQEGNSRRLLLGRCILRYHKTDPEGPTYRSDGFFGCPPDEDGLVMPIRDPAHDAVLDEFASHFAVTRRQGEPGLSVVVPWCHAGENGGRGVTIGALRQAVLEHFFWAIVSGALTVTLEGPGHTEEVACDTLDACLDRLALPARQRIAPALDLAKWALEQRVDGRVPVLQSVADKWQDRPPDWRECLTEHSIEPLVAALRQQGRVAVRIPMTLNRKHPRFEQASQIDVFMEEAEDALRPAFHRGLLLVCDEPRRPQTVQGCRALVVADDFGIARFLALAEVPSHDHWEPAQQALTHEYAYAGQLLTFVRGSVKYLASYVFGGLPSQLDYTLTADFFPRTPQDEGKKTPPKKPGKTKGEEVTPQPPKPPASSRRLAISGAGGSVTVTAAAGLPDSADIVGDTLTISLAYSIRRGDPLKNWQPEDFRLDDGGLHLELEGLRDVLLTPNSLIATIDKQAFRVGIAGFDARRDVFVKADLDQPGASS